MGVFDWLRRGKNASGPITPETLRDQLFDAVAAHDDRTLVAMCDRHAATIVEHFCDWRTVPPEVEQAAHKLTWYTDGMIALANHFRDRRGMPELCQWREDPILICEWDQTLAEGDSQYKARDYLAARGTLQRALECARRITDPEAALLVYQTCNRLATCQLWLGDLRAGLDTTSVALDALQIMGDDQELDACLRIRYELLRFLGDRASTRAAADCLDELAPVLDRLGTAVEAARWRRQAVVVRAGEPLCRVVAYVDDERFEIADVPVPADRVRYTRVRNRLSLRPTKQAVAAGEAALRAGELADALVHFQRAAAMDDHDPDPHLRAGHTHLRLEQLAEARAAYRACEQRAPGWGSPGWGDARFMAWLADQLVAESFGFEVAERIFALQSPGIAAEVQGTIARDGNKLRELAVFHLAEGEAMARLGWSEQAAESFRRGLDLAGEPDMRTRLLLDLALHIKAGPTRERLLRDAVALNGNLIAAARAAVLLAESVVKH